MTHRFDFDDYKAVGRLFAELKSHRFEWYLEDCRDRDLVERVSCEYLKEAVLERKSFSGDTFNFARLHKSIFESVIRLPERPEDSNVVYSFDCTSGDWIPPIDRSLPDSVNLKSVKKWLKATRPKKHAPSLRGSGAIIRKARMRLRWLGHYRLWTMIKKETPGISDTERYVLYSEFLEVEHLYKYGSLHKLNDALEKAGLIIRHLLGTPPHLQTTTIST